MVAPWLPWAASAGVQFLTGEQRHSFECVCQIDHRAKPADARLIELLQRQPDRCGPANLNSPALLREPPAAVNDLSWCLLGIGILLLGLSLGAVAVAIWSRAPRSASTIS